MKIILAASEAFPFCKTGGLADVVGAMAQVFSRVGKNEVILFLPRYRNLSGVVSLKAVPGSFRIPIGERVETASLLSTDWGGVKVYFVDCPKYFDRAELYRTKAGDYSDNDERFIFFSRAVLEGAKFIDFKPDIIHCHDWQTGLVPAYLKTLYLIDSFFAQTRSVFTIHNMAYQGFFPRESIFKAGFGWMDFTPNKLEYYGGTNFLKAGLVFGDILTTVSPTYAADIKSSPLSGRGLEGVLKARENSFHGILNGVDTEVWDPEIDSSIPRGYEPSGFSKGKSVAKQLLQRKYGLAESPSVPLVGIVSRLDLQKGLDIALKVIPSFLDRAQFVILGQGDHAIQEGFISLGKNNPSRVFYNSAFDEAFAHLIYAASDMFLMPSRFEPCGLSQMIAMKYGSLPVAVKTGGLADTITAYGDGDRPTGFLAPRADEASLAAAMQSALDIFPDRKQWVKMVKTGMSGDYSWDKSAAIYLDLFKKLSHRK